MSQYTTELREILANNIPIFKHYPIFDESYRKLLELKITDHFYFREIGCETVGRFIKNLQVKMCEIMPYYNKLYETNLLEQRILDNYDVVETYTKNNSDSGTIVNLTNANETGSTNKTGKETNNNTVDSDNNTTTNNLFSETPQGRASIFEDGYLTDARLINDKSTNKTTNNNLKDVIDSVTDTNESTSTGNTTSNITGVENWTRTMKGNIGIQTDANAIEQYRKALLNVDMLVIEELNSLFMLVY